jgi:MFS family permease
MRNYHSNAKWLVYFAPFKALSISAAYLVPFLLGHGLNQSQIFALQSLFSLTIVLLEVPSGWLADRIGRALSIQLSVPLAAGSMIAYGLSSEFWQFAVCEVTMAIGYALVSGADEALLIDSLKAEGRGDEYVQVAQRINSYAFAGFVAGLPLSLVLVQYIGISATLVADGLLSVVGGLIVMRLVEPPIHQAEELGGSTAWRATKQLFARSESRWLIAFTIVLSTSTYLGAWLAAPYYTSIGIPVLWFSVILAARSLLKAWLSRHVNMDQRLQQRMGFFVLFASVPFLAMATGKAWLAIALIGHDAIHALHKSPLTYRLNHYISSQYRAMLNSVVGLQARLSYAVCGPVAGLLVDSMGLQRGFVVIGTAFGLLAATAYLRLVRLGSFN